jgi:hypothetical protein
MVSVRGTARFGKVPVFRLLGFSMPVSGLPRYVLGPLDATEKAEFGSVPLRHRFWFVACLLAWGHGRGTYSVLRFL